MQNFDFIFTTRALRTRVPGGGLFTLMCLVLASAVAHAQQVQAPFQSSAHSNVEVRHTPGVQVWPSAVGNPITHGVTSGRTPPTITKTENGVKATLNPSWFTKSKREILPSGKVAIICDDGTKVPARHLTPKRLTTKRRVTPLKKGIRSLRASHPSH